MSDTSQSVSHELNCATNSNAEEPAACSTNVGQSSSVARCQTPQKFEVFEFRVPTHNRSSTNESVQFPPRKLPRFSAQLITSEMGSFQSSNICQGNLGPIPSHLITVRNIKVSTVTPDKVFEIFLDVHEYKPEELKVKLVDDFIIIDGEHGERMDDIGLISQQFTRRYEIPEELDKGKISSFISSDGILCIFGLKKLNKADREIPIIPVNKPAKTTKLMNVQVLQRKLHQSSKEQTSQGPLKTQRVEESVSPQLEVVPETKEQKHVPETKEQKHVLETKEQKHVTETKEQKHVPETKEQKHVPETKEQKHIPETKEQKHVPETKEQEHIPETKEQKQVPETKEQKHVPEKNNN